MYLRLPYSTKMSAYGSRNISPTTFILIVTLFVFSSFALGSSYYRVRRIKDDPSWDILIFTQNWPASVCRSFMDKGKNNTCLNFPNNIWTIHGIWPTKLGTIGPSFCKNGTQGFNPEAIYGIEDQLLRLWAPVEKHKKKYDFWAHEWEKHGKCASSIPELSTEFDYFYKGLELIDKYSMDRVLSTAALSPGKAYNITDVWDGVQRVLGKNPQVACFEEKGNVSVLLEIRICLNKKFELVDCDGTVVGSSHSIKSGYKNLTNCAMEKLVQFPPGQKKITSMISIENDKLEEKKAKYALIEKLKMIDFVGWITGA